MDKSKILSKRLVSKRPAPFYTQKKSRKAKRLENTDSGFTEVGTDSGKTGVGKKSSKIVNVLENGTPITTTVVPERQEDVPVSDGSSGREIAMNRTENISDSGLSGAPILVNENAEKPTNQSAETDHSSVSGARRTSMTSEITDNGHPAGKPCSFADYGLSELAGNIGVIGSISKNISNSGFSGVANINDLNVEEMADGEPITGGASSIVILESVEGDDTDGTGCGSKNISDSGFSGVANINKESAKNTAKGESTSEHESSNVVGETLVSSDTSSIDRRYEDIGDCGLSGVADTNDENVRTATNGLPSDDCASSYAGVGTLGSTSIAVSSSKGANVGDSGFPGVANVNNDIAERMVDGSSMTDSRNLKVMVETLLSMNVKNRGSRSENISDSGFPGIVNTCNKNGDTDPTQLTQDVLVNTENRLVNARPSGESHKAAGTPEKSDSGLTGVTMVMKENAVQSTIQGTEGCQNDSMSIRGVSVDIAVTGSGNKVSKANGISGSGFPRVATINENNTTAPLPVCVTTNVECSGNNNSDGADKTTFKTANSSDPGFTKAKINKPGKTRASELSDPNCETEGVLLPTNMLTNTENCVGNTDQSVVHSTAREVIRANDEKSGNQTAPIALGSATTFGDDTRIQDRPDSIRLSTTLPHGDAVLSQNNMSHGINRNEGNNTTNTPVEQSGHISFSSSQLAETTPRSQLPSAENCRDDNIRGGDRSNLAGAQLQYGNLELTEEVAAVLSSLRSTVERRNIGSPATNSQPIELIRVGCANFPTISPGSDAANGLTTITEGERTHPEEAQEMIVAGVMNSVLLQICPAMNRIRGQANEVSEPNFVDIETEPEGQSVTVNGDLSGDILSQKAKSNAPVEYDSSSSESGGSPSDMVEDEDAGVPIGGLMANIRANSNSSLGGVTNSAKRGFKQSIQSRNRLRRGDRRPTKRRLRVENIVSNERVNRRKIRRHPDGTIMYPIHRITAHKVDQGVLKFLVHWEGFSHPSQYTWEAEAKLVEDGCEDYINSYQNNVCTSKQRKVLITHPLKDESSESGRGCVIMAINKAASLVGLDTYIGDGEIRMLVDDKIITAGAEGIRREDLQTIKTKLWKYRKRSNVHQLEGSLDFGGKKANLVKQQVRGYFELPKNGVYLCMAMSVRGVGHAFVLHKTNHLVIAYLFGDEASSEVYNVEWAEWIAWWFSIVPCRKIHDFQMVKKQPRKHVITD